MWVCEREYAVYLAIETEQIKNALKNWDKCMFADIRSIVRKEIEKMHGIQENEKKEKHGVSDQSQINGLREAISPNMRRLDSLNEQQAKLNWLTMGKEMSSMFHMQLKVRKGKSSIMFLFDVE